MNMPKVKMRKVSIAQIITIAPVDKTKRPRRCNIHKYHVWVFGWPVDAEMPRVHRRA